MVLAALQGFYLSWGIQNKKEIKSYNDVTVRNARVQKKKKNLKPSKPLKLKVDFPLLGPLISISSISSCCQIHQILGVFHKCFPIPQQIP